VIAHDLRNDVLKNRGVFLYQIQTRFSGFLSCAAP
jgi:hypothetical protein